VRKKGVPAAPVPGADPVPGNHDLAALQGIVDPRGWYELISDLHCRGAPAVATFFDQIASEYLLAQQIENRLRNFLAKPIADEALLLSRLVEDGAPP
jgi:hypothetical protein